jgi:catecholate siderophore receptor
VILPEYVTVDAVAYWRQRTYDLQLNVYNLLDRKYIVAGHGTSPNLNLPGAPRSAQITARFRF